MNRTWMAAVLALALAGCGGDGGGSPAAVQNDGAEGGSQTTQCQAGNHVVATIFVDAPGDLFLGLHTRLRYPASLGIPGSRDDQTVVDRVAFVVPKPIGRLDVPEETFVNGFTVLNDEDSDFDGVEDRLQAALSATTPFSDGKFIEVTFDCAETIAWPTADQFACEVAGATDPAAVNELAAFSTCSVVVQPPA